MYAGACPLASRTTKPCGVLSARQGGGKRRGPSAVREALPDQAVSQGVQLSPRTTFRRPRPTSQPSVRAVSKSQFGRVRQDNPKGPQAGWDGRGRKCRTRLCCAVRRRQTPPSSSVGATTTGASESRPRAARLARSETRAAASRSFASRSPRRIRNDVALPRKAVGFRRGLRIPTAETFGVGLNSASSTLRQSLTRCIDSAIDCRSRCRPASQTAAAPR
jgi:hypothetical protein